jgi:CheY-like chemotaxis protein
MRVRAEAKGLPLSVQYAGPMPEMVYTDPTRLRQILVNLLGNAIKFTEVGEVRLAVKYLDADGQSRIQVDVIDTGIGMTPEQVDRLFQPFVQADTSTTREYGGTGLGLTISKRLAEVLGGTICVVNTRPGGGTRFRVTVQARRCENAGLIAHPSEADCGRPDPRSDVETAESPALAGIRILLAEDGPDNQRLVAHLLRKAGADVTVVDNGQMAIDQIGEAEGAQRPFHVVLMDMQMPVMDGYEATSTLRSRGYTGRIIALTAHAMAGDRQHCIDAGCDDYAVKPVDRRRLIQVILAENPVNTV